VSQHPGAVHTTPTTAIGTRWDRAEGFNGFAAEINRLLARETDAGQDALERIWDAFERVKTLEPPHDDKGRSVAALLDRAAAGSEAHRAVLEAESRALTKIGNSHRIRHSETNQKSLGSDRAAGDYLFLRMFAFLHAVLAATGRLEEAARALED
jgi:hypothetical protein